MIRRTWLVAGLVILPLSLSGQASTPHPRVAQATELLRIWLESVRDYNQLPGLSAAFVHDQEVVWSGAFGLADRERNRPATTGTLYSICSISKLFTSIALMQQRDAGRVRLDDSVARHLPWFRLGKADSLGGPVTVEGLLTHASGLPREADFAYWTGPDFVFPTREQVIEHLSRQEALYAPETYFQYSNLGLTLAGEIVAAESGEPYGQYVRRRVLTPMGLTSTTPEMPDEERGKRLAVGYSSISRDGRRTPVAFFRARGMAPAAGFASSAEDLARFARWQFQVLARKGGEEILPANTLREMQRVHWVDPDFETMWGLGFAIWRIAEKTYVGHGGSCPGFRAQLSLRPDTRTAAVVLVNAQGVPVNRYAQVMHTIMDPALGTAARDTAATPVDSTLARYAGFYATGFSGETAIIPWEDGLAAVDLPTLDPIGEIDRLRKVGEHTFRRVRKDDSLGETVVFEMAPDGRPVRLRWHQNILRRLR